ncbi:MAG: hypothetical protein H8E13_12205 [Actinobacteria bacterium]|nr:hypothetical protein [Actinomycetota bacterium]
MKKSDLRRLIKEEVTTAEKDAKAAKKIKKKLEDTFELIDANINSIQTNLSSFNTPGLRYAFLNAIRTGIIQNDLKFDKKKANNKLNKYYKR